jgi:uncharacterized protein YjiK
MIRSIYISLLVLALVISVAKSVSYFGDDLNLTYLERFEIANEAAGLSKPSGIVLSRERNALWTISDNSEKVFKLDLNGELEENKSFEIAEKGLEGIALDPTGEFLFMVKEDENEIIKVNAHTQEIADRRRLSEMAGYDTVAKYFVDSPPNKGLEGITWNRATGSIFVMKEGVPGMLVEVSSNLATIQSHVLLDSENGFTDDEAVGDDLDFSDICYDQTRKQFWIISDKGQRVFLYDLQRNKVMQSFALGYVTKGNYKEIKKAEGVAIDPGSNRLFVASEKEARLYVFDIRK